MKNKEIRKRQFGGYTYRRFKEIRNRLRKIDRKDFDIQQNIKFK